MSYFADKIVKLADSVRYELLYDMTFNLTMSDFVKYKLEELKESNQKLCKIFK